MTDAGDLVEMRERSASSHAGNLVTEQVRARSFVNHGCPGSFYPRVRRPSRPATTRGSVSAFTRRPSL